MACHSDMFDKPSRNDKVSVLLELLHEFIHKIGIFSRLRICRDIYSYDFNPIFARVPIEPFCQASNELMGIEGLCQLQPGTASKLLANYFPFICLLDDGSDTKITPCSAT